ncbi:hypothetical protein BDW02DRAFT_304238 [Decorospora gaudefroyi]|uniref:Uncharacterized protein n=1 Tax=Decorospora gaudefroyi TaxID=184978 RepID=A0A6A5KRV9_9PLEO|nr:hypothetical protein BDW02DRAFT_304238 [Decorospora gaudefroyi]
MANFSFPFSKTKRGIIKTIPHKDIVNNKHPSSPFLFFLLPTVYSPTHQSLTPSTVINLKRKVVHFPSLSPIEVADTQNMFFCHTHTLSLFPICLHEPHSYHYLTLFSMLITRQSRVNQVYAAACLSYVMQCKGRVQTPCSKGVAQGQGLSLLFSRHANHVVGSVGRGQVLPLLVLYKMS